jgi:hypothetical protein
MEQHPHYVGGLLGGDLGVSRYSSDAVLASVRG